MLHVFLATHPQLLALLGCPGSFVSGTRSSRRSPTGSSPRGRSLATHPRLAMRAAQLARLVARARLAASLRDAVCSLDDLASLGQPGPPQALVAAASVRAGALEIDVWAWALTGASPRVQAVATVDGSAHGQRRPPRPRGDTGELRQHGSSTRAPPSDDEPAPEHSNSRVSVPVRRGRYTTRSDEQAPRRARRVSAAPGPSPPLARLAPLEKKKSAPHLDPAAHAPDPCVGERPNGRRRERRSPSRTGPAGRFTTRRWSTPDDRHRPSDSQDVRRLRHLGRHVGARHAAVDVHRVGNPRLCGSVDHCPPRPPPPAGPVLTRRPPARTPCGQRRVPARPSCTAG